MGVRGGRERVFQNPLFDSLDIRDIKSDSRPHLEYFGPGAPRSGCM